MKILIAEDNLVNQTLMGKFMNKLGIEYDIASNGREAVDMFLKEEYGMIFMDCEMPIMDGFTATARIRQLEEENTSSKVPIVAVTAFTSDDDKRKCLSVGMDFHIPKPVTLNVIKSIMQTYSIL